MGKVLIYGISGMIAVIEIMLMHFGFMTSWGLMMVNAMFGGYHMVCMMINGKIKLDVIKNHEVIDGKIRRKAINHALAFNYWLASIIVLCGPAYIVMLAAAIVGLDRAFVEGIILGLGAYILVNLAILNWGKVEID